VFPRQEFAFQWADSQQGICKQQLTYFSFEDARTGVRKFLVSTYEVTREASVFSHAPHPNPPRQRFPHPQCWRTTKIVRRALALQSRAAAAFFYEVSGFQPRDIPGGGDRRRVGAEGLVLAEQAHCPSLTAGT
jgi:hypothetical protein